MRHKKILTSTLSQLRLLYANELPDILRIANESPDAERFRQALRAITDDLADTAPHESTRLIRRLIAYEGQEIHELSTDSPMRIETLSLLHDFLTGQLAEEVETDLFVDLFMQFKALFRPDAPLALPSAQRVKAWTERWASGLDEEVQAIRTKNKERLLHALIQRIEHRKADGSRFHFSEGLSYEEKYRLVNTWWNDYRFHLAMAVKSPTELNRCLGHSLPPETMYLLERAKKKGMPFFVTPYYLSLLNTEKEGYDDETLRSYILYSPQLVEAYGHIRAWEREDIVEPGKPNAAGWLLPDGHNIHRRYPEVAILIPDSMGRACGGLCASCQRMYDFQSKRLNFEFDALRPKESWERKLRRLMDYFEEDTQLRDILITGGDALMSQEKTLRGILEAVYRMADRKRIANLSRPNGEKYAELRRVRLGSRLPAYLPMRINDELVGILRSFKEKAAAIGVRQFLIQTHFQSPLEVTPEAEAAIRKLLSAGWLVTNQLVFNVAASRRGHTNRLRQVLNRLGVICYYTFTVKGFEENYAVFAPNSRSLQERQEEKRLGLLRDEEAHCLANALESALDPAACVRQFLKAHHLPFLATDRSVLNLPAIGKSMAFRVVGITAEGKRILRFEHDTTRRHSPIIDRMKQVYIVENKSIAAYLRQLHALGEEMDDYASIWHYVEGETEPRFRLYEYPDYPFRVTERMSHLELES